MSEQQKSGTSFKVGVVSATEPATAKCRVVFEDHDLIESWWLPVVQGKTLRDKHYWMPDVGEHVACLMDEHSEFGVILGAIYSAADVVPVSSQDKYHIAFEDGTWLEYDRREHILKADVQGRIEIKATGDILAQSGANVEVLATGDILAQSGANVEAKAAGDLAGRAVGNAEIRAGGIGQMICGGSILIKSGVRVVLESPGRRMVI